MLLFGYRACKNFEENAKWNCWCVCVSLSKAITKWTVVRSVVQWMRCVCDGHPSQHQQSHAICAIISYIRMIDRHPYNAKFVRLFIVAAAAAVVRTDVSNPKKPSCDCSFVCMSFEDDLWSCTCVHCTPHYDFDFVSISIAADKIRKLSEMWIDMWKWICQLKTGAI